MRRNNIAREISLSESETSPSEPALRASIAALVACLLLFGCGPRGDAPEGAPEPAGFSSAQGTADPTDPSSIQRTCPGDTVVWLNTRSGIYHLPGQRWYGATSSGKYICKSDADGEGDRETENGQ